MAFDFGPITADVCRIIWGDPNPHYTTRDELRWGSKGSRSCDLKKGVWRDHEADEGGGTMQLLARELNLKGQEAIEWLRSKGFDIPDQPQANGHDHTSNKRTGGKIVATYSYVDEFGDLLFQVQRKEFDLQPGKPKPEKTFLQRRRADPDTEPPGTVVGKHGKVVQPDGWVYDIEGVRRVPYRLPELIDALSQGVPIFIAEGEKKVDALWAMGIPATCNAGGSKKWQKDWNPIFKDADIVLLPDNDEAGKAHVARVAPILVEVCKSVKVLELPGLPHKGDVVDWIASGGTDTQFYDLLEKRARDWHAGQDFTSQFKATWFHEVAKAKPRRDWLVKNLLLAKSFGIVYGAPGCGKSFLTTDLCLNAALYAALPLYHAATWFGYKLRPFGIVYVVAEGGDDFEVRLHAWRMARNVPDDLVLPFVFMPTSVDLASESADTQKLADEITQLSAAMKAQCGVNVELIVIDTVARALAGGNENASDVMGAFVVNCNMIQTRTNAAVIGVHHGTKDTGNMRGHGSLHGAADLEIEVQKPDVGPNTVQVKKLKAGPAGDQHRFTLRQMEVGKDEDGDAITSCTVTSDHDTSQANPARKPKGVKLNPGQLDVVQTLADAIDRAGVMPPPDLGTPDRVTLVVPVKAVKAQFISTYKATEAGAETDIMERLRKRWSRAMGELMRLKVINSRDPWMWFTGRPMHQIRPRGVRMEWDNVDADPDNPSGDLVTDSAPGGTIFDHDRTEDDGSDL